MGKKQRKQKRQIKQLKWRIFVAETRINEIDSRVRQQGQTEVKPAKNDDVPPAPGIDG